MNRLLVTVVLFFVSTAINAAEVVIDVGDSETRIVCVDNHGEMVIERVGSGRVAVTLIDGYSWGCRHGSSSVFYDLSMPAVGMVGGVVVRVDMSIVDFYDD